MWSLILHNALHSAVKGDENIFELRKTNTVVTPHKSPTPLKPPTSHKSLSPSPSHPTKSPSTCTMPTKPAFTPRIVLKHAKPSASKTLFPPLSEEKPVTTHSMGSQLEQSASHNVLTPSSQKSPKVAMVQPQPHIGNKKPVARVLPSLKTPVKSIASQEEASSAREEVKDDNKEKEAVAFGPPLPADLLSESALSSQAPIVRLVMLIVGRV